MTILAALAENSMNLVLLVFLVMMLTGVGLLCLRVIPVPVPSPGTRLFFAFSTGSAVTGALIFWLGAAGLLSPVPLTILLAVLTAAAIPGWRQTLSLPVHIDLRPQGAVEQISAVLLAVVIALGLILALAPETGRDALIYHLNLPKLYLRNGGFYAVPGNIYSHFPLHTEMLYTLALFLRGDVLAKLLHYAAFLVVLLGIRQLIRERCGKNGPAYLSLLIFSTLPTVFYEAHMAYIDLFVTLYAMAAVWAFMAWQEGRERGMLVLAALCCGTAMACKYTALFLPLLGVTAVLWTHRDSDSGGKTFQDLALFIGVVSLFGTPFYVKSWLDTGNPFYPFFYRIFGGEGWDPRQAELFDGFLMFFGMGRSALDYLLLPWNLSVNAALHTPRFDGVIGPLFLVVLPLLACLRPLPAWLRLFLAYSALTFLFWASGSQQLRFLLPVLPFLALAAGYVVVGFRGKRAIYTGLLLAVASTVLLNARHLVREFSTIAPERVVFGRETRSDFLRRSVSSYSVYDYINRNLPADARIFLVCMKNMTFLCDRTCFSDTMFESYTLQKILSKAASADEVQHALLERKFTHLAYDDNYLLGDRSTLTRREKELFLTFRDKHLRPLYKDRYHSLFKL